MQVVQHAMRVRNATSAGSRFDSSRPTRWSRSPPACAIVATSRRVRLPATTVSASWRPSGQPSVSSCRRAHSVVVDAGAEALAHQHDRLVELESEHRRADDGALPVVDEVVEREMAVRARGHDHMEVRRRIAQQVHERVADRRGRCSASSTISTTSSAVCANSASQVVMPSRPPGAAASSSVWPKVGRPARQRTASARPAPAAADRPATARTARRRRRRARGARAATAPAATSCRSRAGAWTSDDRLRRSARCRPADAGGRRDGAARAAP